MTALGICAVQSGSERRAQRDIERAGFGTRLPSYRVSVGDQPARIRPLFPGMIFADLAPGYGSLNEIEGVRILANAQGPLRLYGADAERFDQIELACLMGEFNRIQFRNPAGRFVSSPTIISRPRQKKRRRRSLLAKADRRRKRRAKRRGLSNHTDPTNHIAA